MFFILFFKVCFVAHQNTPSNTLILENNHPTYFRLLGIKLGGTDSSRTLEQFELEGTLKITKFQPPYHGQNTFHWNGLLQA